MKVICCCSVSKSLKLIFWEDRTLQTTCFGSKILLNSEVSRLAGTLTSDLSSSVSICSFSPCLYSLLSFCPFQIVTLQRFIDRAASLTSHCCPQYQTAIKMALNRHKYQ